MCNCINLINKKISDKNMQLTMATIITNDLNILGKLCVVTEKIDRKVKKKLPLLTVSFCPFCGGKV
jgi:hypothetical protein